MSKKPLLQLNSNQRSGWEGANKLDEFTNHINTISPIIKLTVDKENDKRLPFLDVNVVRGNQGLKTSVYRKTTHIGRYLNYNSDHSVSVKEGVAYSLFDIAKSVCLDNESLNNISLII